ncbi:uncharacterized protein LOC130453985 isoform X2 [Monodelphis domestica]|uniref:uncharacterized protein LOC130453985 isoform X2 n=1 Tax=Monodelphis domestica TaxID=13616 RepID=UPI0024E2763C|nr:uncharacterized protein LOC130453985 isoform X2 [Monodelphis domestica]
MFESDFVQDESAPMSAAEAPPKRKEVAFPPQYPVPRTKGSPGWTWDKGLHYPGPLSQLMDQRTAPALPEVMSEVMSRAEAAPMPFGSQQKLPLRREEERKWAWPRACGGGGRGRAQGPGGEREGWSWTLSRPECGGPRSEPRLFRRSTPGSLVEVEDTQFVLNFVDGKEHEILLLYLDFHKPVLKFHV